MNLDALSKQLEWTDVRWPLAPKLRRHIDAALRARGITVDWRKQRRNPKLVLQLALTMAGLSPDLLNKTKD